MRRILATNNSLAMFLVRLGLGVAILPHGLQKVFGLFGGPGFSGSIHFLTGMRIPLWLALLVIIAESLGALGLIVGFLTRIAAIGIVGDMIGAAYMVHYHNGFFMNWSGQQRGEGIEYHILAIAMGLAIIVAGAGRWSLDRRIAGGSSR
jgi:putative oxidoreductase